MNLERELLQLLITVSDECRTRPECLKREDILPERCGAYLKADDVQVLQVQRDFGDIRKHGEVLGYNEQVFVFLRISLQAVA